MNKLRDLRGMIFTLVAVLSLNAPVLAQINTPATGDGVSLTPLAAPCVPFHVAEATGTTQALVRSGAGYIAWVYLSTPAAQGDYVTFRDTGSVNNTNIAQFRVFHSSAGSGAPTYLQFSPPMGFANGLTITMSAATNRATACTRLYSTQTP